MNTTLGKEAIDYVKNHQEGTLQSLYDLFEIENQSTGRSRADRFSRRFLLWSVVRDHVVLVDNEYARNNALEEEDLRFELLTFQVPYSRILTINSQDFDRESRIMVEDELFSEEVLEAVEASLEEGKMDENVTPSVIARVLVRIALEKAPESTTEEEMETPSAPRGESDFEF